MNTTVHKQIVEYLEVRILNATNEMEKCENLIINNRNRKDALKIELQNLRLELERQREMTETY